MGAVFLSYASEDAAAAERIALTLRTAGIEVWFDKSDLRGGDAWDRSIRQQIRECRLFLPVISAHSDDRREGYFRREWKLAVDRTQDMSERVAFLVPVVIDGTSDSRADVPDRFREVQWTHLPAGETPPAFVERVRRLLSGEVATSIRARAAPAVLPVSTPTRLPRAALAVAAAAVIAAAAIFLAVEKPWSAKPLTSQAFAPPPHSIAVLPFVNMSGDKQQEYFSEGMTEELLDSLSRIDGLQVAARTSSFSFQGEHPDLTTVAHKLNVAAILEGSVRRSGQTVRVSAQLINTFTGFHVWSQTYDRDLGDVLKLQTEIATAVAEALKVTLLGDVSAKIELGGTRDPAAFDAYLRGLKAYRSVHDITEDIPAAIAAYTEAVRLDPHYAIAFAARSFALSGYASEQATAAARRENFQNAQADARRAVALAPDLAPAHAALGYALEQVLDFAQAAQEYERAVALAPGDAQVLRAGGRSAALMGHFDGGIAAVRRAVVLDPLTRASHGVLGQVLLIARRFDEGARAFAEAIRVAPEYKQSYGQRGLAFYGLGDYESARASCEIHRENWVSEWCLAVVYHKLGRRADAEAALNAIRAAYGDAQAYTYAETYAQWDDRPKALEWLDTAMRLRDPGLEWLKTDFMFDPLQNEPRFQAIERELKFP